MDAAAIMQIVTGAGSTAGGSGGAIDYKAALDAIRGMADGQGKLREANTLATLSILEQLKAVEKMRQAHEQGRVAAKDTANAQRDQAGGVTRSVSDAVGAVVGMFQSAQHAAMGFVSAASPAAVNTLRGSFSLLAGELGMMVIPAVVRVSVWFQEAATWVRNLDADTKESIGRWVAWGAALITAGTLGKIALGIIGSAWAVVSSVAAAASAVIVGAIRLVVFELQLIGRVAQLAFGLLTGNMSAAGSAVTGLWALVKAHPFLALASAVGIAVGVVMALSGAFGSVSKQIENAGQKVEELEALLDKLAQGGKVDAKDLAKLTPEAIARVETAGGDPHKQRQVMQELKQEADEFFRQREGENRTEQTGAVRHALSQNRDFRWGWREKATTKGQRIGDITKALEQVPGVGGNAKAIAEDLYAKANKSLSKNHLTDADIEEAIKAFNLMHTRMQTQKEVAESVLKNGPVAVTPEDRARLRKQNAGEAPPKIPTMEEMMASAEKMAKEMMERIAKGAPPGVGGFGEEKMSEAQVRAKYASMYSYPKEMNPGFQAIDQARKTFQQGALIDPIEVKLLDMHRRGYDQMHIDMERMIQEEIATRKAKGTLLF